METAIVGQKVYYRRNESSKRIAAIVEAVPELTKAATIKITGRNGKSPYRPNYRLICPLSTLSERKP